MISPFHTLLLSLVASALQKQISREEDGGKKTLLTAEKG